MFHVTICGHDSHHRNPCDMEYRHGLPEYLFLIIKTRAWMYLDGHRISTDPGMAVLFDKNTYIHYGCDTSDYNDDWIHFSTDSQTEDDLIAQLEIPLNRPLLLPDVQRLSRLIQPMSQELRFPSVHTPKILDSLMTALLLVLAEDYKKDGDFAARHRHYSAFLRLRTELCESPSAPWSAEKMAASLNLSVSRFQHLYKQFFQTSPQLDLIHARLELAKYYLANSNMSISALASFCGYESEIHFMRQFKKFEGLTPSEFRHKMVL